MPDCDFCGETLSTVFEQYTLSTVGGDSYLVCRRCYDEDQEFPDES